MAAKKSLEDDQKATWELEDKWKREKSAREACQHRITQMEVELPARMEQERIYRQNQEQLKLKLQQSRDKFKAEWEKAKKKLEDEHKLVTDAQVCVYVYEGVCMHMYMYMCVCMCVHIHIYIYISTVRTNLLTACGARCVTRSCATSSVSCPCLLLRRRLHAA